MRRDHALEIRLLWNRGHRPRKDRTSALGRRVADPTEIAPPANAGRKQDPCSNHAEASTEWFPHDDLLLPDGRCADGYPQHYGQCARGLRHCQEKKPAQEMLVHGPARSKIASSSPERASTMHCLRLSSCTPAGLPIAMRADRPESAKPGVREIHTLERTNGSEDVRQDRETAAARR